MRRYNTIPYKLFWLFILVIALQIGVARNMQRELRGVWMTNVASSVMFSKPNIAEAMDSLAAWGINAVFPVIYNNGYTLYPSLVMQSVTGAGVHPMFEGRDVLAELVAEGHRVGIEVHPWIEYGFVASFGQEGGPILANNPDWAGKRYNMDTAESDDQFYWMSQANEEVRQFLIALAIEIIQNYDVDGIQLDRIRYGNVLDNNGNITTSDFGYDDAHVNRYREEHDGADPPPPTDPSYMEWRSEILNEFMWKFYDAVKAENPHIIVSNTPVVYPYGYNNFMQDWRDWVSQQTVDMINPQLYRHDLSSYVYELNKVLNGQIPEDYEHFYPGMLIRSGNYQAGIDLASGFVQANRERDVRGGVFWFYEGLPAIGKALRTGVFSQDARPLLRGIVWRPKAPIVQESADSLVQINGAWQEVEGSGSDGYYSSDGHALSARGGSGASVTYYASVDNEAYYNVYVYQPYGSDLAQAVPVKLLDGSGITKYIDESDVSNRGWTFIETMYFQAGEQPVVELSTSGVSASKTVVADGIMLQINRRFSPDVVVNLGDQTEKTAAPDRVELLDNYPNPFNPETQIRFSLPKKGRVTLKVYDCNGRLVRILLEQALAAGRHSVRFHAGMLSSGMYFVRMAYGNVLKTQKILFVK